VPNFMLFLKSAHFSQYIAPYGWTIDPNLWSFMLVFFPFDIRAKNTMLCSTMHLG
jgi:hypothetical protein